MSRIFMSHSVADYDTWRAIYDDDAPRRAEAGIAEAGHFHSPADRNQFLIVWDMDAPLDEAKAVIEGMLSAPDLGARMQEAGVLGPPEVWVA
jgi:hypothetical protein